MNGEVSLHEDMSNVSSTGVPSLSGNELFMGFIDVMEQDGQFSLFINIDVRLY